MFIISLLRKKYPLETSIKKRIYVALGFSVFITLFLLIFQPFGIAYGHRLNIYGVAFGSGFICLVVSLIIKVGLYYFFPHLFKIKTWTIGKELSVNMLNISIIGLFNILYAAWAGFMEFNIIGILTFEFYTISVAFFPNFLIFLVRDYFEDRKLLNQEIAKLSQIETKTLNSTQNPIKTLPPYENVEPKTEQKNHTENQTGTQTEVLPKIKTVIDLEISSKPLLVKIPTENKEEDFEVEADNLLYIQAADNYLEIIFLENQSISKKLIRNTLKSISEIVEKDFPQFFRCHKSYLINLHQVKHISGNAQGYKLHLFYGEELIPVSRKNNSIIKQKAEIFIKKQV